MVTATIDVAKMRYCFYDSTIHKIIISRTVKKEIKKTSIFAYFPLALLQSICNKIALN
jgi:hypothetical protein